MLPLLNTRGALRGWREAASAPVVLVPTMGALHEGHAALIRTARQLAQPEGSVVVSIFVNPTQFGPGEDYSRYPRTLAADEALCRAAGADVIFQPEPASMYLPGHSVTVEESALSRGLCGAARPGHFRGVCTVVAKLFHLVQPETAVFGEKDYQQLAIIRRMVRDLDFPVRIVGHPTVREADGLALSSRNRYLTAAERTAAAGIPRTLEEARRRVEADPQIRVRSLEEWVASALAEATGGRVDYAAVVDAESLEPLEFFDRPARLAVAVHLGAARLIDNVALSTDNGAGGHSSGGKV